MSERLLEAFREDAERLTRRPPFELIEAAGRARRRRRHAIGGMVAACLLAATGIVATTTGDTPDPRPADDPEPRSLGTLWPGVTMTTVEAGTYEFPWAAVPDSPLVRVTVPQGWNAWVGPNRFEGMGRAVTDDPAVNEGILEDDSRWYAGLLVLKVHWVAQRDCTSTDVSGSDSRALVRALTTMPRFRVTAGPQEITHDGHPAIRLRLQGRGAVPACSRDSALVTTKGAIGGGGAGSSYDVLVVDTEVGAVLIWAEWTSQTPQRDVDDLLAMVDSVEVAD